MNLHDAMLRAQTIARIQEFQARYHKDVEPLIQILMDIENRNPAPLVIDFGHLSDADRNALIERLGGFAQ